MMTPKKWPGHDSDADGPSSIQRFRELIEAAPDAMVIVDGTGRIVLSNRHTARLFGWELGELVGQDIEVLVPERLRHGHPEHRQRYMDQPRVRAMGTGLELHGLRRDGTEFPVEISLSPLYREATMHVAAAIRDVTERRRIEMLRLQGLEEASRLKSEFLANMSHELRTPLNSVIGFAKLLHSGKLGPMSDEHHEYVGDILTSAGHLLNLINDVLDVAKIEAGKMSFHPEHVDLAEIVGQVCDGLRTYSAAKAVAVSFDVAAGCEDMTTDPRKLKQVLYNYVSNALKFTPEGGHVAVHVRAADGDRVEIAVEDDGIGIDEDDQHLLFTEFGQIDAGTAKRHPGTGLGLALTRRIVEAQGGTVGVESRPGVGSTFYAMLPRQPILREDSPR